MKDKIETSKSEMPRRNFIKIAAVGSLGLALAPQNSFGQNEKYN